MSENEWCKVHVYMKAMADFSYLGFFILVLSKPIFSTNI